MFEKLITTQAKEGDLVMLDLETEQIVFAVFSSFGVTKFYPNAKAYKQDTGIIWEDCEEISPIWTDGKYAAIFMDA